MDKDMGPKIDLDDRGLLMSLPLDAVIDSVKAYYLREIHEKPLMRLATIYYTGWKLDPFTEAWYINWWCRNLLSSLPAVKEDLSARNPIGYCAWSKYSCDGASLQAYMAVDYTDREELESCPSEQLVDAYEAAFYDLDVDISVLRDVIATRFPQEWAQYSQREEWEQYEDRGRYGLWKILAPKLRRLRTDDGKYRCDSRELCWFSPVSFTCRGEVGWSGIEGWYLCEGDRITMHVTWCGPYIDRKTCLTGRILTGGDILLDDGQRYRFYPDFE